MVKRKKKKLKTLPLIIIKLILVVSILSIVTFYFQDDSIEFSNTAALLAVNEDSDGNIRGGSVIDLTLEIRKGSGEIFVNANSLKEIDTQQSIRNGHRTACQLFELNCSNYDYYFTFDGGSELLKGPSATAVISLLTAKTTLQEEVDSSVTMTGSLNSAGVVGTVSGIPEKIEVAQRQGFDKVLVPLVASEMIPNETSIEVKPVLDLFDVYNEFGSEKISPPQHTLDDSSYKDLMSSLVDQLCQRSQDLKDGISGEYQAETRENQQYMGAVSSINSSQEAVSRENFYSASSFCFTANNNLQILKQFENNESLEEVKLNAEELEKDINDKYEEISSSQYTQSLIQTQNDFYILILLHNRIDQAKNLINESLSVENESEVVLARNSYALAKERLETVNLWETFIVNQGEEIRFSPELLNTACMSINNDVSSLSRILDQYGIDVFDDDIEEQLELINTNNPYLCIYNGLELVGRINTVFYSFNLEENPEITGELFELTESRIAKNSGENFPLIPFIYYEYSEELYNQGDFQASLLYINFAQSFSNLEFYLQTPPDRTEELIEEARKNFLTNPLFLLALLLLLGFIR